MADNQGIVGGVTEVSKTLISNLTPQFLVLVILNIAFLSLIIWFESVSAEQKLTLMNRVMDMCVQVNPPPNMKEYPPLTPRH